MIRFKGNTMQEGKWTNGKKELKGRWSYYRPGSFFTIEVEQRDRTTGAKTKIITSYREHPEWGNWKLVRDTQTPCP